MQARAAAPAETPAAAQRAAPGKPDSLRVDHLPSITVPCLFVHGTRDPFGSLSELEDWTRTIPGIVSLEMM